MGAWGFQAFENDDALDWVEDLEAGGAERRGSSRPSWTVQPTCSMLRTMSAPPKHLSSSRWTTPATGPSATPWPSTLASWATNCGEQR